MRTTHTYVTMEISAAAYYEISGKLRDTHYDHCFLHENMAGEIPLLVMAGIALKMDETAQRLVGRMHSE